MCFTGTTFNYLSLSLSICLSLSLSIYLFVSLSISLSLSLPSFYSVFREEMDIQLFITVLRQTLDTSNSRCDKRQTDKQQMRQTLDRQTIDASKTRLRQTVEFSISRQTIEFLKCDKHQKRHTLEFKLFSFINTKFILLSMQGSKGIR